MNGTQGMVLCEKNIVLSPVSVVEKHRGQFKVLMHIEPSPAISGECERKNRSFPAKLDKIKKQLCTNCSFYSSINKSFGSHSKI